LTYTRHSKKRRPMGEAGVGGKTGIKGKNFVSIPRDLDGKGGFDNRSVCVSLIRGAVDFDGTTREGGVHRMQPSTGFG